MLLHTVENTFDFILAWVPFWAWMRFFIHFYLILPGSQGATFLYQEYLEPFLYHHEREIDDFITETHDRARSVGLTYLQQGIEWVKVNVLGFAPQRPATPPSAGQSYAQSFMSRFTMPSARGNNDLVSLVSQALSGAGALYAGNKDAQAAELNRSANLVPDSIRNNDDRLSYVGSQRERIFTLLQAFDREAENLKAQREGGSRYYEGGGLSKSRSETEFDRIERDEIRDDRPPPYPVTPPAMNRRTSSGWMPWNWQRYDRPVEEDPLAYGEHRSQGRSTGYDRDR